MLPNPKEQNEIMEAVSSLKAGEDPQEAVEKITQVSMQLVLRENATLGNSETSPLALPIISSLLVDVDAARTRNGMMGSKVVSFIYLPLPSFLRRAYSKNQNE